MKWSKEQTAAKVRYGSEAEGSVVEERLLEQHVDSEKEDGPNFYLYYFAKDFTFLLENPGNNKNIGDRTVLFMSGGPGEVNRPGNGNFGDLAGYRIVYFHLRGAGFSQLPRSNYFDRFLRTRYAVEDIEKIRKDLLDDKPWAAIVAHSYGTVLAQQYAHKYGTERVRKLVLSAPLSRHKPTSETVQFRSLRKIYEAKYFDPVRELIPRISDIVAPKAEDVSKRAEEEFGSVNFLTDVYSNSLKEAKERLTFETLLKDKKLDYSLAFFKALRRLRLTGWLPHDEDLAKGSSENVDTVQQLAGLLIAIEILQKESESYDMTQLNKWLADLLRRPSTLQIAKEFTTQFANAEAYFKTGLANTPRVFYVVSIYDGINERFLQKVLDEKADVKSAIKALGGKQNGLNESLGKIAVENEAIKRWDPKQFMHKVPTLILDGGADPVTEGGQAQYVFKEALSGDRALIRFPGIGHSMSLPRMVRENLNTRDYLLQKFLARDFDDLKTTVLPKVRRAFNDLLEEESHKRFKPLEVQAEYISKSGEKLTF
jgi:pimeloyl-ACP methyl ester carboxylesterase